MRHLLSLGLTGLLGACVTTPPMETLPQVRAWLAAGGPTPPPVESCPHVAEVDLWDMARSQMEPARAANWTAAENYFAAFFSEMVTPEGVRPTPGDAPVILRAVEPPGGMYPNTVWSVVWKESDGSWWYWRQNRDPTHLPSPPAPPPPGASEEEQAAYQALFAGGGWSPPDHVRWPPGHGRLSAHQVEAIEAALGDPCRAWEPDIWSSIPPIRGQRQPDEPPPFQDSTPIYVQIEEMDRAPRYISAPREHPSHAATIRWVAYGPELAG